MSETYTRSRPMLALAYYAVSDCKILWIFTHPLAHVFIVGLRFTNELYQLAYVLAITWRIYQHDVLRPILSSFGGTFRKVLR